MPANKTHGMRNTKQYKLYGAKGIKVCDRWKGSFVNFWGDIKDDYNDNLCMCRVDTLGDYAPGNVYWTTLKVQNNNRQDNRRIIYKGKSMTIAQLRDLSNVSDSVIRNRLFKQHKTPEQAISEPLMHGRHRVII